MLCIYFAVNFGKLLTDNFIWKRPINPFLEINVIDFGYVIESKIFSFENIMRISGFRQNNLKTHANKFITSNTARMVKSWTHHMYRRDQWRYSCNSRRAIHPRKCTATSQGLYSLSMRLQRLVFWIAVRFRTANAPSDGVWRNWFNFWSGRYLPVHTKLRLFAMYDLRAPSSFFRHGFSSGTTFESKILVQISDSTSELWENGNRPRSCRRFVEFDGETVK